MKTVLNFPRLVAAIAPIFAVALLGTPAGATILVFDNVDGIANNWSFDNRDDLIDGPEYGSYVAAPGARLDWKKDNTQTWVENTSTYAEGDTPNIRFLTATNASRDYWGDPANFGDLFGVMMNYTNGNQTTIYPFALQADAGYQVLIESVDLSTWADAGNSSVDVAILSFPGDTVEWSQNVVVDGTTHTTVSPMFTGSDPSLQYWLQLTSLTAASADDIGVDNVAFSQSAIPEPSTIVLMIVGAAFFFVARRWRK